MIPELTNFAPQAIRRRQKDGENQRSEISSCTGNQQPEDHRKQASDVRCQMSDAAAARARHLSSSTPRMRSHRIMTTTFNRDPTAATMNMREPSGG